jgi:5-(carboxyamino)imidazole ribonucleotide synthase
MHEKDWPLYPPSFLGILGGGQLGRFFVQAAQDLGYGVCVLDPDPNSPAGQIAQIHLQADYADQEALKTMARRCRAISTEFENVPAKTIDFLIEQGVFVAPDSYAVSIAQNRIKEKQFFQNLLSQTGVGPVLYHVIEEQAHLTNVPQEIFPAILKTSQLGYDGKGQQTVYHLTELLSAWIMLGKVPCVLEKKVDLDFELSALIVRSADDEVHLMPIAQNIHQHGILHLSMVPAPNMSLSIQDQIQRAAQVIIRELHYVGVMCIEFFILKDGTMCVNEIAPRPHNSGHHSLDSCLTSQFEQQVRVLAKLPLGNSKLMSPVVMLNLLGDLWLHGENNDAITAPNWQNVLAMASAKLHLYGKAAPKIGRKMGHINFLDESVEQALKSAHQAMEILGFPTIKE